MKTLYLMRHAKSSWDDLNLSDHDRPLNKRGNRDANSMGELLRARGLKPDLVMSSTANRARTTAGIIIPALGISAEKITLEKAIYEASVTTLKALIRNISDEHQSAMLFGHNPGFTWTATELSGNYFENVPTCGMVSIEFSVESWQNVSSESGKLLGYDYPKKYFY